MGELLGTINWEHIKSEVKDKNGSFILNTTITGLVFAIDQDDQSKYIIYAYFKEKVGSTTKTPVRVVIASNILSLGAANTAGTSVIDGGSNVKQYSIGFFG